MLAEHEMRLDVDFQHLVHDEDGQDDEDGAAVFQESRLRC